MAINIDVSEVFNGGGPLIKLEAGATYNIEKFPNDIADTPYFIVFRSVSKTNIGNTLNALTGNSNFSRRGLSLGPLTIDASVPTKGFALPIPYNLTTAYNARYSDQAIGPLGNLGQRIGQNFSLPTGQQTAKGNLKEAVARANLQASDFYGPAASMVLGGVESGLATLVGGIVGNIGGAVLGEAASGFATGALRGAGIARNPHLASIFQGVDFKTHNFEYKLIAKNKKESDTLRSMIRGFKYAMAPNYAAGDHIFEYPNEFDIILAAGSYLFQFGRSVLTDFSVNYNGEGIPAFFEDSGAPYSVVLNMTFKETSIVTKREIGAGR